MKRCALFAIVLLALSGTELRLGAQPVDGVLALNITGPNWLASGQHGVAGDPTRIDTVVANVYNSGVRWVFLPVVWFSMEETAPTSPPCAYTSGTNDGVYYYYSNGPSGQCHRYTLFEVTNLDRLVGQVSDDWYSGLKGNGNYIAMGMYGPPMWAGNQSCEGVGEPGAERCAMIYRDHLTTFSNGAQDFARFLVTRYTPLAFSVWNEPDGFRYLSIQPDSTRISSRSDGPYWPAWQDYATYLLQPIAADIRPRGVSIIAPELATKNGGGGNSDASDPNWPNWCGSGSCGSINVGYWVSDWEDYLLRNYSSSIDVLTIHAYGNAYQNTPWNNVLATYNELVSLGLSTPVWVTEANMDSDPEPQHTRADWVCNVKKLQAPPGQPVAWSLTFWSTAADANGQTSNTNYNNSNANTNRGLMAPAVAPSPYPSYYPKWLLQAYHSIILGPPYYVC